jgi:hypothetical protein
MWSGDRSSQVCWIETRLIDDKFASVMGECDLDMMTVPSKLSVFCV